MNNWLYTRGERHASGTRRATRSWPLGAARIPDRVAIVGAARSPSPWPSQQSRRPRACVPAAPGPGPRPRPCGARILRGRGEQDKEDEEQRTSLLAARGRWTPPCTHWLHLHGKLADPNMQPRSEEELDPGREWEWSGWVPLDPFPFFRTSDTYGSRYIYTGG